MRAAIFAYSRRGCETARKAARVLPGAVLYAPQRLARGEFRPIPQPSGDFYGRCFREADALVFVGSCGIAVRMIAPHVRSKTTDPAVTVIDEGGAFAISLLSGHIGGANALTERLARQLGATPVITTATDRSGKFSVDAWAAEHGFLLSSMELAKAVSAEILERDIHMVSDFPVESYPAGVVPGAQGELGVCISWETKSPFPRTLRLIPRALHLGVGCRKGISAEAVRAAVGQVFAEHGLELRAVKCAASIDLKAEEAGLLEFFREADIPISFYPADRLRQVPGDFTPSAFVEKVTGVDNVCERAALLGADRLIVRKTACSGVTVAVAAEAVEVDFG